MARAPRFSFGTAARWFTSSAGAALAPPAALQLGPAYGAASATVTQMHSSGLASGATRHSLARSNHRNGSKSAFSATLCRITALDFSPTKKCHFRSDPTGRAAAGPRRTTIAHPVETVRNGRATVMLSLEFVCGGRHVFDVDRPTPFALWAKAR